MLESLNTDVFEYEKLKPEEMQRRGILGRLVGIMADTVNPTRNGRSYSSELWENVFNNPIMKERIENNCCFGELGHPSDREETDMTKIAICMDGLPKKDKDGKLRAVFNILDTPNGRILKSLCDYGCNIGISSRGSGDLITDFDGNESVDPDTYNCEGWDAVIIPAVKEARLTYVTEALEKKRYNKSLRDKLKEAINKETEDNKKIMTESLSCLGIRLNEDSSDIDIEDKEMPDSNISEPKAIEKEESSKKTIDKKSSEENNENDFFYKGVEILKDPNSDKFVCEIEGDSYSFNSIKNAKIWVDINGGKSVTKSTDIRSLPHATQQDIENTLSKVLSSDSEVQKAMHGKLSELDSLIDVNKYLTEEQVGRDEVKDDKNIDDVLKPEVQEEPKEDTSEEDKEKEEDKDKVTVTITESIDWADLNGTEQSSVEAVAQRLESGEYRYLDDLELDCNSAVSMYNEANAFDEYADEEFYEEEGDPKKVYEYILNAPHYKKYTDKLIPYKSNLKEELSIYPVEFTYDYEDDDKNETFFGHINVKANSEEEALKKAEKYVNSNEYGNKHVEHNQFRDFRISNTKYSNVDLVEDIDDINAARMQLCQLLDDWYKDNIANERAEDVKLSGWDADLQNKYLDFRNYLAPDLIQDKEDFSFDVDNIESEIDSLQEMLNYNKTLEKQIIELNEKLSVSHAMEKSLKSELRESKEKISKLSKISKENKVLTEQLTAAKDSTAKLNESKQNYISKIKSLQEQLSDINKEKLSQTTELDSLREDYELLNRDLIQTKEQFSKKFEKQNNLLEKYQKITKNAVDRYINMQATNLGVKPIEIKNKLSESFTFNEIDAVCEDLRKYKLNVSRLPFNTSTKLNENISITANNVGRNSLIPRNEVDELSDYDLKLMEAYL